MSKKGIIISTIVGLLVAGLAFFIFINLSACFQVTEPTIVTVEEPMYCVGLKITTSEKTVSRDLPYLYAKYMKIKEEGKVKHIKEPWEYISLSNNFSEKGTTWDYYTGYRITDYENTSNDLIPFSIPAGQYAVFQIRGINKLFLSIKMSQLKRYIYTQWLTRVQYEFTGYEYEYSTQAMHQIHPSDLDLYVGIKAK